MGLWGYLLICLISGLICGFIAESIAANRGMNGGFWWGFWLTVIGIIVVAVRPNDSRPMYTPSSSSSNSSNTSARSTNNTSASVSAPSTLVLTEKQKSFKRVYTAPENLYTPGSPIIIVEGALLKDEQTKRISALLKMKNISAKTIKAVKVKIWPQDTVNMPLGDPITHEYLDMEIPRDVEFGQEEELPLPDDTTRAFRIEVLRVAFTDNSFWSASEQELKSIPKCRPLQDVLKDYQLINQYKLEYGQTAAFLPQKAEDLWFCTCGAVNKNEETVCHKCGNHLDSLHEINVEELEAAKEKRLEEERKEQLRIETEKRIAQEIAQKKKEEEERLAQERRDEEEKLALVAAKKAKAAKKIKRFNWLAAIPVILIVIAMILINLKEEMQIPLYILGLLFVALPFFLLLHIFLAARIISFRNHNRDIIILSKTSFGLGCIFIIIEVLILWVILRGENTSILESYLSLVRACMNMLKALGK